MPFFSLLVLDVANIVAFHCVEAVEIFLENKSENIFIFNSR